MKKILAIIGARPQFIKHFPLEKASFGKLDLKTIHTGQHYNSEMSQIFFDEFGMSKPTYMLDIGSGKHGVQTGKMMSEIEKVLEIEMPDGVIVYGDTNSTLAGALVAAKMHIPIYHIEAGIRSYNKEMPEEVNRVLTDHISKMLFVPSKVAIDNLRKEGITSNVYDVGDIMKDLIDMVISNNWVKEIDDNDFFYATIHRPYNTDDKNRLFDVLNMLNSLSKKVIFSIHPRTSILMKKFGFTNSEFPNIRFIEPQGYINNLSYLISSKGLITDSGGMQKEAYWTKKKCITIRKETEWTETLKNGWNTLNYDNLDAVKNTILNTPKIHTTLYGDGNTASKIVDLILADT